MTQYPKRLIEVDLPIKRISAHARREKSIRHGHISTLHIWWARRPLAACRAVICAALWPDPADAGCPPAFREAAAIIILDFARKITTDTKLANDHCSPENYKAWSKLVAQPSTLNSHPTELRTALLDFIADFANWDNSTVREYLDTSRALTQAAHEALGGAPGTRPLVVDPFAGGGSIPLEALRVGADAFASDLNPVPVLLNKVVLEYIPKYGQRLADEVRKWGEWIKREAEKELAEFYPKDADGATPIAYLWARTIQCEGPGCGAEVPLMRSLWLAKKANRSVAMQIVPNKKAKRVDFQIIVKQRGDWVDQDDPKTKIENPNFEGSIKRGSATCPCCGYTTPVASLRKQLKERRGGTADAKLFCVVTIGTGDEARSFRLPGKHDVAAVQKSVEELKRRQSAHKGSLSLVPDELVNPLPHSVNRLPIYGMVTWGDVFLPRQSLAIAQIINLVHRLEKDATEAARVILAIAVSRYTDISNSLCMWEATKTQVRHAFTRQALPMLWDFAEANALAAAAGNFDVTLNSMLRVLENLGGIQHSGKVEKSNAATHPLADDMASAFVTDPPYYDMISYADLSDFFYVWLRRACPPELRELLSSVQTPKAEEIIVEPTVVEGVGSKDESFYLSGMTRAMTEGRRVTKPDGIGIVVFAHKSTSGWEALLSALLESGWIITGSWPIDTELANKLAGIGQARLMSSVHLVCRPRENPDGSVRTDEVGDWRGVLQELPRRIHEWMPRLAEEGVVGADAIFACLGPALEIFSRYSRVEKSSGEIVPLKEFLEQVWAAVAKEALALVFKDADATGFEEDARLTAMWLWTLNAGNTDAATADSAEDDDDESEGSPKKVKATGFILEYDAARKIAQGLGAHLEDLGSLVEISGETARLLPVGERARHLFGKDEGKGASRTGLHGKKKKTPQLDLFKILEQADEGGTTFGETNIERHGATVLDRIHQSMILFAAGRSEAMKRFLVEDGAGRDQRFWRLAQALSALYPPHTEEKRWVDGVLARKKGLGF